MERLNELSTIDVRRAYLISVASAAAVRDEDSVRRHAELAMDAGATREDILEAIEIAGRAAQFAV